MYLSTYYVGSIGVIIIINPMRVSVKWLLTYIAFVHDNDGEKLYLKPYEGGFYYVDMEFKFQFCAIQLI